MLSGFKIMLFGFKRCCVALWLFMHAALEAFYILLSRLAGWRYNEDCTLPDSGCWFKPNSYLTRRQLFVAVGTPGRLGRFSLSFGLQVQRLFQAYSGPLGGIGALLEFPFESQGDILGRTIVSRSGSTRRNIENICLTLLWRNKNMELFSLPVDLSPIWR